MYDPFPPADNKLYLELNMIGLFMLTLLIYASKGPSIPLDFTVTANDLLIMCVFKLCHKVQVLDPTRISLCSYHIASLVVLTVSPTITSPIACVLDYVCIDLYGNGLRSSVVLALLGRYCPTGPCRNRSWWF